MSMNLQIPSENPNFNKLLSVTPIQFFQQGDINIVQPVLRQLMFGNMSQLINYPNQLLQVVQLLQLSLQYFTFAQETYAQQCEANQSVIKKLQQENAVLQNQVNLLNNEIQQRKQDKQQTPAFILQMQAIKEANELIIRENYQLKEQMKKMAQAIVPPDLPTCQYCNKKFVNKDYLAQHMKHKHKQHYDDFLTEKTPVKVHKYNELPQNIDFTLSTQRPKRDAVANQGAQNKRQLEPLKQEKHQVSIEQPKKEVQKPIDAFVNGPTPYELEKQIDTQDFEQIQLNFNEIRKLLDNYKDEFINTGSEKPDGGSIQL